MPAPEDQRTTISMTAKTRDRLRSQGRKGESYDELVLRILDELEGARVRLAELVEFEPVEAKRR